MKNYEVLEHTADIGIRVKASSLDNLFRSAGLAITDISIEKQKTLLPEKHKIVITQKADNIAKIEEHKVNGIEKKLCVHRKGATCAFGLHDPVIPQR
ncbi:MAG: archease [Candidatus Omnitrophica bacterium]|nr:archease [Candidatus Omnitrophota bacterium]